MENIEQKVDQIFAEWDHTNTPGCSLAVIKDGQIIYSRGYGMANLDYGIPIRPDTVFHIASISKHFAALAVTLLAHEGKLSLDDEIQKYVPEVPDFGEKITLRHLIHHTSGLRDQWELLIAAGWRMDDVITMDDILELVSKQRELNFKPGEKHVYCNTGYTLLSFTVQRVTGKTMREFCEERLFKSLGMKHTHFHDDHTMIVPNRATSYAPAGPNKFRIAVLSYANVGATSLFTTVEDMALWDQEFYEGKVFGKDVIDEMHTQGLLNSGKKIEYAQGLVVSQYRGLKTVEHGGADAGYRTQLLRFPDQHFSVVVFANLGTIAPSDLVYKIADLYLADLMTGEASEETPVELPVEAFEKMAGQYYCPESQSQFLLEMRDGKLFIVIGPGFEVEAIAQNKVRVKRFHAIKAEIVETPDGQKMHMYWGKDEEPEILDKVTPPVFEAVDLEKYAGQYTSPELEVTYQLLAKDGALALQRRKYGITPLKVIVKDTFCCEDFTVRFTRDAQGELDGMKLTSGRMHGLKFVRQQA